MENETHSTSTFTSICRENIDLLGVVIEENLQLTAATANSTVISVCSTYTAMTARTVVLRSVSDKTF